MERVLAAVRDAGAKIVLVGDPESCRRSRPVRPSGRSLSASASPRSPSCAGSARAGSRRPRASWRQGGREKPSAATSKAGAVHGHATLDEAKAALLSEWETERKARPDDSRIMLAHTRADVRDLNERARKLREDAGETYWGVTMPTENGERRFSVGDEVLFGRNDRGLSVKNGTRGKVDFISGIHGDHVLEILVPEPGGEDRLVKVRLAEYGHLDHGYAATVHKTQGVTVDRAHVLATRGMNRHMAYVALTRHRDGVALHWSADELGSREGLARTLSRERLKDTSLDYGEGEPAAESDALPMRAFAERRGLHPHIPVSQIVVRAGQAAARSLVSLSTLARRRMEQQALAGGLRPMLGLLHEQKQLLERLLGRVARDSKPAASSERPSPTVALRGPGALSLALEALAQRWAQSPHLSASPLPPKPHKPASQAPTASARADNDATMRQELTLVPTSLGVRCATSSSSPWIGSRSCWHGRTRSAARSRPRMRRPDSDHDPAGALQAVGRRREGARGGAPALPRADRRACPVAAGPGRARPAGDGRQDRDPGAAARLEVAKRALRAGCSA